MLQRNYVLPAQECSRYVLCQELVRLDSWWRQQWREHVEVWVWRSCEYSEVWRKREQWQVRRACEHSEVWRERDEHLQVRRTSCAWSQLQLHTKYYPHATCDHDQKEQGQWRRSVLNLGGVQSWGHLSPSVNPPFSFPLVDSAWIWAEPAHPLPNILMQFTQSNSLIKFTFMFNVGLLPGTENSVHATVGRTDTMDYKSCTAKGTKKVGGPCTLGPPHCQKVRGSGPLQDRRHWSAI